MENTTNRGKSHQPRKGSPTTESATSHLLSHLLLAAAAAAAGAGAGASVGTGTLGGPPRGLRGAPAATAGSAAIPAAACSPAPPGGDAERAPLKPWSPSARVQTLPDALRQMHRTTTTGMMESSIGKQMEKKYF